jgi:uncharacterized protein with PhoU and TrkA domain
LTPTILKNSTSLGERLHQLQVVKASKLVGMTSNESRLGDAIDVQILCIVRQNGMVLTQCLTMEEACRHIEWKAGFSIAGSRWGWL